MAVAILLAACSAGNGSSGVGPSTSAAATPSAEPTAADVVPVSNLDPDRGCLDEAGKLNAHVTAWSPGPSGSPLRLDGERDTSAALDSFRAAAAAAVRDVAPEFTADDGFELARASGCITHRYAAFTSGDDTIVVSAWRVESAADPFWIPNEIEFVALDDSTLVSSGDHIVVVLAVAPDGTTARVSAYGARAAAMTAGWPTTMAPSPSAPPPGLAAVPTEELVPVARSVLAYVLDQR